MATGSTTKQTLLDQIDNKVATANATELSQLAKSLNNVQEIIPEDKVFGKRPSGPQELYFERDPEFVIWCGRQHNHSYTGGGSAVYDSNLEIYDSRKYIGYHCYGGCDGELTFSVDGTQIGTPPYQYSIDGLTFQIYLY